MIQSLKSGLVCVHSADPERGRFSYMGGRGGALWQRILYHTSSSRSADVPTAGCTATHQGVVSTEDAGGVRHEVAVPSFFCWLEQRLAQLRLSQQGSAAATLPFDFWGGFVGYLGYELKQECGFVSGHDAATPDAAMFLVDRCVSRVRIYCCGARQPYEHVRQHDRRLVLGAG